MSSYLLYVDNQIYGPYTEADLRIGFQSRRLPEDTPACDESRICRRLVDLVPSLFAPPTPPPPEPSIFLPASMAATKAAAAPVMRRENSPPVSFEKEYEGIGRLAYFGANMLLLVVSVVMGYMFKGLPSGAVVLLMLMIMGMYLTARRMKNIGWHQAWCLTDLFPLVGAFVSVAATACPPGYAVHHKLDAPGKVVVVLFVVLFVICIAGVGLAFMIPAGSGGPTH